MANTLLSSLSAWLSSEFVSPCSWLDPEHPDPGWTLKYCFTQEARRGLPATSSHQLHSGCGLQHQHWMHNRGGMSVGGRIVGSLLGMRQHARP